jgi:glucosamine 6-phosphate synthetase-like amidotransferase/phosphosugar isomerase protein
MCGIYGFIGKSTNYQKVLEIMESLGIESEIRGVHATGYYGLNNEPIYAKAPIKATDFFKTEDWKRLYNNELSILVGHNRWAVNGDPSDNENNHPFFTNRFGFVHNGVVSGIRDKTNPKLFKVDGLEITIRSDCDSELMFRYFLKRFYNDHNAYNSIEKTMKAFQNGNLACALVDAKDRYLYLFRNDGRPLHWFFVEQLNVMFYASTSEIIKNAFLLNGIAYDEKKCHSLKNGQIMRVSEELKLQSQFMKIEKPKIIKYVYSNFKPSFKTTTRIQFTPKKVKKVNKHYECKKCKRQFVNAQYAKKHIEDEHKIFDLDKIGEMIEGPNGAKISFIAPKAINDNLLPKPALKPKTIAWDEFKKFGVPNLFDNYKGMGV